MIAGENAAKQVDAWRTEDGDHFLAEVKKLPVKLRRIGYAMADLDAQGKPVEPAKLGQQFCETVDAVNSLDTLPPKERMRLFAAVSCNLAPAMEQTWQFLKKGTYQQGMTRKSFRAPGDPDVTLRVRWAWLCQIQRIVGRFRPDVVSATWLAAWAPYLGYGVDACVGSLLAAVIDSGEPTGDEVFDILCRSARNEHEIGSMGRHVAQALLMASRTEGWELMERMLLAAQRQEGLRQVILETVDEAHPEAFRRMLCLIRDHELARFSSVVRAANVWFGLAWDSATVKVVNATLDQTLGYLEDPTARAKALAGGDPEAIHLALWSIAFHDAIGSIPCAAKLLQHKREEIRFVAAVHLGQLALPHTRAVLAEALDDADLRVADCALRGLQLIDHYALSGSRFLGGAVGSKAIDDELFERLQQLFDRMPRKPEKLKPLVWPWAACQISQEEVANCLVVSLGNRPPTALIPYLPATKSHFRWRAVQMLIEQKKWDCLTRETLVRLAGDPMAEVRTAACEALSRARLQPGDICALEGHLTRKTADLRQGVMGILLRQPDDAALASADRLLDCKDPQQRLAGLEILRQLAAADRKREACRKRAETYRASSKRSSREEQSQIDAITAGKPERIALENALGLLDPAERSAAVRPRDRRTRFLSEPAVACLRSLDELVHEYRETPVRGTLVEGSEIPLGALTYGLPYPDLEVPPSNATIDLPLAEVWERWHEDRPKALRDKDGLELVRADAWLDVCKHEWNWESFCNKDDKSAGWKAAVNTLSGGFGRVKLRYPQVVDGVLAWLLYLHPATGEIDFLLDATETSFALVPDARMQLLADLPKRTDHLEPDPDWRETAAFSHWPERLQRRVVRGPSQLTKPQAVRLWQLFRWLDEPFPKAARRRPDLSVLRIAYESGAANRADFLDHLLGPDQRSCYYGGVTFVSLWYLTQRELNGDCDAFLARCPEAREILDACSARIVEIELARGETPTAATEAAWSLGALWGTDLLVQIMTVLGKQGFKVPIGWQKKGKESKVCTITQLASVAHPKPGETLEDFSRLVQEAVAEGRIGEKMLLELAFLAPQWARHVEGYLQWSGFSEALYWFLAHMRYASGLEDAALGAGVEEQPPSESDGSAPRQKSAWERLISERTALSAEDRGTGAVDVGWFRRVRAELSPKRWQAMAEAARFAANAAQARRAQFIADVLTGKASRRQLIEGIRKKKLKDYVRLLGLYPLAEGAKRQADLHDRYRVIQDYRRYARGLSAMTKPEALRSVEIGMQNLASTAGYVDPLRLEWALEAEQVEELARGPRRITKDGVTVSLALDADARPQITVQRAGKPLKSIPPALKKDKRIAEFWEQASHVKRQAARMKASLETAMCRGDAFSGAELAQLGQHAILAPLLRRLVLIGDGIMGYPDHDGRALRDPQGKLEPVKKNELLRIAHAHDLFVSGCWSKYQHECFQNERVQPFKQVFRELYVVTKLEKRDGDISRRYAGQQVQPQQATALWGQRGWNSQDGVYKVFHDAGLTAAVSFVFSAGTPLEVEGWTIEGVSFQRRDEMKSMKLAEVPPRIFSEVMRDMDLVVSVAHRGGVDPEASASTIEMRASLLRETCSLLGLENVRIKNSHALVDGRLGNYSIHLGGATVHRMPGGAICLIAVPAAHRGRLFLPFADDDPRTAEVISKAILLARDEEIQDPTILEQLRV